MTKDQYEYESKTKRFYLWERRGVPRRTVEIKCCGEWVHCANFTNTCDHCHADYNFAGGRLAPRSCWGEETGEAWFDCY